MSLKTLIEDNRRAIEADPAKAAAAFAATGHLAGTTEVAIRARGHELTVDEPPVLGGADLGANPVEHALIDAHCPVHDIFTHFTPIERTIAVAV
jgi:hypothetical protein